MPPARSRSAEPRPLVLDTSVLINLHASRQGMRILGALPNPALVPEEAAAELQCDTGRARAACQFVRGLEERGAARIVAMDEVERARYDRLVSGPVSLEAGESATIAIASGRNGVPVIDERKGRLVAREHCADAPRWSLELFLHPMVAAALGADAVAALHSALRDGRMRVAKEHCDRVVRRIGVRRALECRSLPGYKSRRHEWRRALSGE